MPVPKDTPTIARVWAGACDACPALTAWTGRLAFARNGEYASPESAVGDGDEVAAIPPVSGG